MHYLQNSCKNVIMDLNRTITLGRFFEGEGSFDKPGSWGVFQYLRPFKPTCCWLVPTYACGSLWLDTNLFFYRLCKITFLMMSLVPGKWDWKQKKSEAQVLNLKYTTVACLWLSGRFHCNLETSKIAPNGKGDCDLHILSPRCWLLGKREDPGELQGVQI